MQLQLRRNGLAGWRKQKSEKEGDAQSQKGKRKQDGRIPEPGQRTPAPAVATDPTSALQNSVIAAAVLRSASGVSFINRL